MPRAGSTITSVLAVALLAACASPTPEPAATALDAAPGDDFTADLPPVATAPAPAGATDPAQALADLARAAAAAATPDAAPPAHLRIPSIGVDTPTIDLDLTAETAEVPASFDVAGWYRQTKTPGTVGPAVIVGHVGSRAGPGVFADLDRLIAGDRIEVTDVDGATRTFVVSAGALVDKHDRPPEVFGWVGDRPELRLITCGGEFDVASGHHVSNYVIWAHEVET